MYSIERGFGFFDEFVDRKLRVAGHGVHGLADAFDDEQVPDEVGGLQVRLTNEAADRGCGAETARAFEGGRT